MKRLLTDEERTVLGWRRDFYEATLDLEKTGIKGRSFTLAVKRKVRGAYRPFLLKVAPVKDVFWTFSQETLDGLVRESHFLLITNIVLISKYIESRSNEISIDGFPNWNLRIVFIPDKHLSLDVISLASPRNRPKSQKAK